MDTPTLEVLCDHSEIGEYRDEEGVLLFEWCKRCGLPPESPELICHPGELLLWSAHKAATKKRIDATRPGVNALQDLKIERRELAHLLIELIAYAREVGEEPKELIDELAEVEAQRREIWPMRFSH